jgi:hypothetical protein
MPVPQGCELPLDIRIAVARIRLYELPFTRIVHLTADQFYEHDTGACFTFDKNPCPCRRRWLVSSNDRALRAETLGDGSPARQRTVKGVEEYGRDAASMRAGMHHEAADVQGSVRQAGPADRSDQR